MKGVECKNSSMEQIYQCNDIMYNIFWNYNHNLKLLVEVVISLSSVREDYVFKSQRSFREGVMSIKYVTYISQNYNDQFKCLLELVPYRFQQEKEKANSKAHLIVMIIVTLVCKESVTITRKLKRKTNLSVPFQTSLNYDG